MPCCKAAITAGSPLPKALAFATVKSRAPEITVTVTVAATVVGASVVLVVTVWVVTGCVVTTTVTAEGTTPTTTFVSPFDARAVLIPSKKAVEELLMSVTFGNAVPKGMTISYTILTLQQPVVFTLTIVTIDASTPGIAAAMPCCKAAITAGSPLPKALAFATVTV